MERDSDPRPRRRPMAVVSQLPLIKQEIIEKISLAGFEVLLGNARRISEGQVEDGEIYYGSTMITLDLARPGERIRSAADPQASRKLAELMQKDRRVRRRLERIGREEAARVAGQALDRPVTDLRITTRDAQVLVDIDVEGALAAPARRGARS